MVDAAQKRIQIQFWTGPFIKNNLDVSILKFVNRDYAWTIIIDLL